MIGACHEGQDPQAEFKTLPELSLHLTTLDNAWFTIDNGIDGMVMDRDGFIIEEASMFHEKPLAPAGHDLTAQLGPAIELDDVFVGNDAAWHNYFHFLFYGVARCHFVQGHVPETCQLVMPDYASRSQYSTLAYSQSTYDQAFALSGLTQRVTKLKVGLYRARTLRFLWPSLRQPTDFLDVPGLGGMFTEIRKTLSHDTGAPRRLLVSRDSAPDPRIGTRTRDLVRRMCLERGFTIVRFEEMDLQTQAQAMFNADCLVAPHGAGLGNIMFGRDDLRVLELGCELDGNHSLRACFFQIAAGRDQPYMLLNGSRGEIHPASLARALDICCSRPPPS